MKRFLKDVELAEMLGIPLATLRADRQRERRIPFVKLGASVWYDVPTVLTALNGRFSVGSVVSVSDGPGGAGRIAAFRDI